MKIQEVITIFSVNSFFQTIKIKAITNISSNYFIEMTILNSIGGIVIFESLAICQSSTGTWKNGQYN